MLQRHIKREELSSIFLEFLDLFGDAESIKKANVRHAKLFLPHKSDTESKKHHLEGYLALGRAKLAKNVAQIQWAAGYAVQPQATQAQGQQWPSGYTQQAAYGTYNAYGSSYVQPQVSTSVPQVAASDYTLYPALYPVQAVPQQVYPQQSVAAIMPPAQQPAAPAYYGTYY